MEFLNFLNLSEPMQIMDVGASAISEVPIYKVLLDMHLAQLNAFEGDLRQIEAIQKNYGDHATIYKDFLFDGSQQTLYLASGPSGMTSLLKPDLAALQFFNGFETFGHVEKTEQINTQRMDDIEGLPLIDFLKMDIQGAELTVLKNGTEKLKNCVAVQLEVSYICLYENQPSFGEIDVWMRSQGFVPHCFLDIKRWSIKPTIFNNSFRYPGNQLLESDIVYVKNPMRPSEFSDMQLKKLAAMAHYCFKSHDLCVLVLLELERRQHIEPNAHQIYLASLANPGPADPVAS
jgi:FkbM family methyltransferase